MGGRMRATIDPTVTCLVPVTDEVVRLKFRFGR